MRRSPLPRGRKFLIDSLPRAWSSRPNRVPLSEPVRSGLCSMGYDEARQGDGSRSQFRLAEKRFKLYKERDSRGSKNKGNRRNGKSELQAPATCLDGVIDFQNILHSRSEKPLPENIIECRFDNFDHTVFAISGYPGFFFIPEALDVESQRHYIIESLTKYPQPPNRTNHSAVYGQVSNIWKSAQEDLLLIQTSQNDRTNIMDHLRPNALCNSSDGQKGSAGNAGHFENENETRTLESKNFSLKSVERNVAAENGMTDGEVSINCVGNDNNAISAEKVDEQKTMKEMKQEEIHEITKAEEENNVANCSNILDTISSSNEEDVNSVHWSFVNVADVKSKDQDSTHETSSVNHEKMLKQIKDEMSKNESISAKTLLRKLRWTTLGIQFDWSKRSYNPTLPFCSFPQDLANLSSKLAYPAMKPTSVFHPQAAIVNFYGPDDMLGGHVDDMEKDWSKPIVSLSLGCKAIFLLGGTTKEETPIAMFVRSGDAMLLSGHSRQCYHGVPRIFTNENDCEIPLSLTISNTSPSFLPFAQYISTSRININIREVGI